MSCVFRISSKSLHEALDVVSLKPYRFERDTAHFQVSECAFSDLAGQVGEATAFLRSRRSEVSALLAVPNAHGVLDFAVETPATGFRFLALSSALVRESGLLGIAIELSLYPEESVTENVPNPSFKRAPDGAA